MKPKGNDIEVEVIQVFGDAWVPKTVLMRVALENERHARLATVGWLVVLGLTAVLAAFHG